MKKRIFTTLFLLLLCFSLLGSFPSFANNDVPVEIKVGVYDFAGFTEASSLGKHIGYAVDYFNEIERSTNLKFVYVETSDWNACSEMLQKGELDIIAGTVKTPEREETALFSSFPMATSSLSLCVSQNSTYSYADYDNFGGMIIATTKNDTRTARLRRHASDKGFAFKMAFYSNQNEALAAVYSGEADAFLSDKMRVSSSERSIDDFGLMPLYFMINKDKPWLKDEIDNAMETILIKKPSFNDDLYAKHFQSQMYNMPSFTQQEKKLIENTDIVALYYNPYLAPLSYNSQGNAAGICIDIADVLSKRIGIQLDPVSMPNMSVENSPSVKPEDIKKILISCVFNNKSLLHEYSLQATDTYLDVPVVLVGKDSTTKRQSGKTVAINTQDRNLQYYLAETYPYLSPVFVDNMNDCFAKMLSGEIDYTIQYSYIVNDYLQTLKPEVVNSLSNVYDFMPVCMAVPDVAPKEIVSILNKVVGSISTSDLENIILKNTIDSPYKTTFTSLLKHYTPLIISFVMLLVAVILSYIIYTKYKLAKIAYTDDLTGQDNYAKFLKEAAITIEHSSSNFAVVALDINNFKILNDTLGRDEGDSILQQVATGLKKNLRRNELVARNTADNFVMLTEFSSNDEIISRLKNFCDEFLLTSIHTGRVIKTPTFSIGIYPVPPGVNDVCQMTSNADLARKSSKATHTNVFAFYDKDLHQQILQEKKLELTLVSALQNREFEVYLQPKFSLNTRKIIGAEALVRWNHPQKGLLPPGKFISICERTGLIVDLDFFVYERTFEIIASWLKRGIKPVPVSVNVSRVHLQNPHFVEAFIETANHYDIPHELIECELTENLFFDDMAQLNTVVDEFKQSNFFVSIDDFGSGYSSLNMLKDVPVDILKLDREFFSRDEGVREKVVIQNIIRMAKELDMKVICEGVETEKQASFLQSVDCNMAQGYLFARPVPLSEFEKLLIKSNEENKQ